MLGAIGEIDTFGLYVNSNIGVVERIPDTLSASQNQSIINPEIRDSIN